MDDSLSAEIIELMFTLKTVVNGLQGQLDEVKTEIKSVKAEFKKVKTAQTKLDNKIKKLGVLERKMERASGEVETLKDSTVSRGELKKFQSEVRRIKKKFSEIGILEVD